MNVVRIFTIAMVSALIIYLFDIRPKMSVLPLDSDRRASAIRFGCSNKKAAIILFGVPKQFSFVWKSYWKNIVLRNQHIEFEVYMHMYSDLHQNPFSNFRNQEYKAILHSPGEIQVFLWTYDIPVLRFTESSQLQFDKSELAWLKKEDRNSFDRSITLQSMQNMFRQGNSLREAFLTMQKNINVTNDIDLYVFARSDTYAMDPVDIPCTNRLGTNDIWVPSWQRHSGMNDRFAMAGQDAAKVYASRINGYKKTVLSLRNGTVKVPKVGKYSAELMNKNWLIENKINITEMDENWAILLRVRADGRIELMDRRIFGIKYAFIAQFEKARYRSGA
ncbi:hypothetical protein ACHAWF_010614 [Thalassiosira exigua]